MERPQQAGNTSSGGAVRATRTLKYFTHEHAGVRDQDGRSEPHSKKDTRSHRQTSSINARHVGASGQQVVSNSPNPADPGKGREPTSSEIPDHASHRYHMAVAARSSSCPRATAIS